MIIYHPDPLQLLAQETPEKTWLMPIPSGGHIEVAASGNNQVRVVKICSTDPRDYLNQHYQPGAFLNMEVKLD